MGSVSSYTLILGSCNIINLRFRMRRRRILCPTILGMSGDRRFLQPNWKMLQKTQIRVEKLRRQWVETVRMRRGFAPSRIVPPPKLNYITSVYKMSSTCNIVYFSYNEIYQEGKVNNFYNTFKLFVPFINQLILKHQPSSYEVGFLIIIL